jgi:hypothetical protein
MASNCILDTFKPYLDSFFSDVLKEVQTSDNSPVLVKHFLLRLTQLVGQRFSNRLGTATTELEYRIAKKIDSLNDVTYFTTKLLRDYGKNNGRGGEYNWSNISHLMGIVDSVQRQLPRFHDEMLLDVLDDLLGALSQTKFQLYEY